MPFQSALVLFAHPDDAEFMCGGTIAAWSREGCEIHYVVITDGSAGSNDPATTRESLREIREREQQEAAEVLGVRTVTFLGELDGMLEVTLETRRKVAREVRRHRPDVLVAPDPSRLWFGNGYINHSDHKAAGMLALSAVMPDAPTRLMFPELLDEGFEPFEVPNLWLGSNEPDTYVDISGTIDLKVESLARHMSQGGADAGERVRQRAEEIGAEAGHRFAEAFKTFRFVDDDQDER
jgi:LmbE family N-acetylglucosaminyl deacetylase